MSKDLFESYALALSKITPVGTPANEGVDALLRLVSVIISSEPEELLPEILLYCEERLRESLLECRIQREAQHSILH
jgi:energy-converting hydrogenase Eha subunit F